MNSKPDKGPGIDLFRRLFVFEAAEDILTDPVRGTELIQHLSGVTSKYDFNFAFRFACRAYDVSGYPNRGGCLRRTDREAEVLSILKNTAANNGFLTALTAYDEDSVDNTVEKNFDIISVASSSFTDWPLLEKIARTSKPIMAFTAYATLEEIERVHLFFKNRDKIFCLMHCTEDYSPGLDSMNLGQIDVLRNRFPEAAVGSSTRESSDNMDAVKIAIAKGADVFERRITATSGFESYGNHFSTPDMIDQWLSSAADAYQMCQIPHPGAAQNGRQVRRGAFAKYNLSGGSTLDVNNTRLAFPCAEHQLSANEMSKKTVFHIINHVKADEPITLDNVRVKHIERDIILLGPASFKESVITIRGINCYSISNMDSKANKLIIHVHGGGFVSGSLPGCRNTAVTLAGCSDSDVLSVDYRLAPEHPFPAALDDVVSVYGHLLSEGRSSSDIGFYGESSGGGIILAAMMKLRDGGENLPAALACSSPWADLTNSGESHGDEMNSVDITLKTRELDKNARMYAGDQSLLNPYISPAYGDFSGFPPMLLFAGTREVLRDDARLVAEKAKGAGVFVTLRIVESMPHVFTMMTGVSAQADEAMREIGRFFSGHLSKRPASKPVPDFEQDLPTPSDPLGGYV